jgi:hypothetical protein
MVTWKDQFTQMFRIKKIYEGEETPSPKFGLL